MRSTAIGSIDMGLASIANDLRATADGTAVVTGPQYLILNTVKTGDASEGRHWITVTSWCVLACEGGRRRGCASEPGRTFGYSSSSQ